MNINLHFGTQTCQNFEKATDHEWLVTNGIGGYSCGTISGVLTRRYHGLLIAALKPPVQRTLLLTKLEETVNDLDHSYDLFTNRWLGETINPHGYVYLNCFDWHKNSPLWTFQIKDIWLEKQIWMKQGENTTYITYTLKKAPNPVNLSIKALINYRDHHHDTQNYDWKMNSVSIFNGLKIIPYPNTEPFYLLSNADRIESHHQWHLYYDLAAERYRGLNDTEHHLHIATFNTTLEVNDTLTIVATTEEKTNLDHSSSLNQYYQYQDSLLSRYYQVNPSPQRDIVREQLVLSANQFIVNRTFENHSIGKTIIAGYPWFTDWGRDTMISLTGLTLVTGQFEIAREILLTFSHYLNQGMLPNCFPDAGESPIYNTVDAVLWYFESLKQYYNFTHDLDLITQLFPQLSAIIDWHCQGTRYNIHLDTDGLIYAGELGEQLTWMDAKVGDWVVTPRTGKAIEINALWYNALTTMMKFSQVLGLSEQKYESLCQKAQLGFQRFWNEELGYCYDVLDTPNGNDTRLRVNQIFAVSLGNLLNKSQEKAIVDIVAEKLLIPYGLRTLSPDDSDYQGRYGGNQRLRDGAYHQGTAWSWLIGHFVQAHLKVYQNPEQTLSFLRPMQDHLLQGCVGTVSEIFDGNPPHLPRGCFAQAWGVAEVLRGLYLCQNKK